MRNAARILPEICNKSNCLQYGIVHVYHVAKMQAQNRNIIMANVFTDYYIIFGTRREWPNYHVGKISNNLLNLPQQHPFSQTTAPYYSS